MVTSTRADLPLVSVLTPSFRQAKWIGDNLRSVAEQTYPRIEHIVMDGGSTDGTLEILRTLARPSVIWKSEPDQGQSQALNKAFSCSSGEIIGWLNSDDAYFGPTVVEEVVRVFEKRPDVAAVSGHAVLVDGQGRILQALWVPPFSGRLLRLHDFVVQPATFVRRRFIAESFVDETFDYTMDSSCGCGSRPRHRLVRLERIIAIDRHHSLRKSYTMQDVGDADHVRLAERYGVHRGLGATVVRKLWKVGSRLAGASLVGSAMKEKVAFDAIRDTLARLLMRQILAPRAAMSTGDR